MNPNDDFFLTAYLDDELAPAQRGKVEAALLADPRLASRLHDLTMARDLIGRLDRPAAPVDLSARVLARIHADADRSRRSQRLLQWGTALAAAAVLIVAFVPFFRRKGGEAPELAHRAIVQPDPARFLSSAKSTPKVAPNLRDRVPHVVPNIKKPFKLEMVGSSLSRFWNKLFSNSLSDDTQRREAEDREWVANVLDRDDVIRLMIVVDTLDKPTVSRVEDLVRTSGEAEKERGRITVAQGVAIDPARPGKAVIFAMAMTPASRERLSKELKAMFPGRERYREDKPAPDVMTLLADAGDIVRFEGEPLPSEIGPTGGESPVHAFKGDLEAPRIDVPVVSRPPGKARSDDFKKGVPRGLKAKESRLATNPSRKGSSIARDDVAEKSNRSKPGEAEKVRPALPEKGGERIETVLVWLTDEGGSRPTR